MSVFAVPNFSKAALVKIVSSLDFRNEDYKKYGLRNVPEIDRLWWEATHKVEVKDIDLWGKTVRGTTICEVESDGEGLPEKVEDEEREHYRRCEKQYMAEAVLEECGWDDFVKTCEDYKLTDSQWYLNHKNPEIVI